MTTKDFQKKPPLLIFLSYFKNHKGLFVIDVLCAVLIAAIDLVFPLVTRSALYDMLPNSLYTTFFTVIGVLVGCYLIRSLLNYIVAYYGHTFGIRVEADIRADLSAGCFHDHGAMPTDCRCRRHCTGGISGGAQPSVSAAQEAD